MSSSPREETQNLEEESNQLNRNGQLTPFQIVFLLAAALIFLVIILSLVAYLIWGFVTLFGSMSAIENKCNNENSLWTFSLITLFFTLLQLATGGGKDSEGNVGIVSYIFLGTCLGLTTYGIIVWNNVSTFCEKTWTGQYPDLYLLFHLNVIFLCVQSILIISLIFCGAIMLGWLASIWAHADEARRGLINDGFERIRDRNA